ncbi:Aminopeptidase [Fusobacterium necrophorum subsp. funduliforme]|uniref:hypothetical protein n=1 Tax=Fusobacterium necrophorum TaxID=859 RepID=UPI00370F3BFB
MNHKIEFKKRCETLQETISFLLENNFHFSIYSHQYIDDEYFNFSNTLQLWKENNDKELYLEIGEKEETLYIYADDYSARTRRPDEVIKNIGNIKNYLKR